MPDIIFEKFRYGHDLPEQPRPLDLLR